jgi:pimeloyl-ACP methyl ester carboxylesterase
LIVVTGTFAEADVLSHAAPFLPGCDVLRTHLPGNHCPPLITTSVGAFSAALREAITQLFGARPIVVVGLSVGALVALGLRHPNVRRIVAIEPPIFTRHLWPLAEGFGQMPLTEMQKNFVWQVLGFRGDQIEGRDYSALVAGLTTPTILMLGDEPLWPRRELSHLPSLVDDEARALLMSHPSIRTQVLPGVGHNIPRQAPMDFLRAMQQACAEAASANP